jgi:hypothetical protein
MKYLLISFFLFLFVGCSKVIEIDFSEHNSKPTVNALFEEGKTIKMVLSKSVGIVDDIPSVIATADIYLFCDGIPVDTLFFNGNKFESHETVISNANYSFIAFTQESEQITSFDLVPTPPIISDVAISESTISDREGFQLNQKLSFTINDTSAESNYYELVLIKHYYDEFYQDFVNDNVAYYYTQNPIIENENILQYYPESLIFSDNLFNESIVNIDVYYNRPEIDTGSENINFDYTLIVLLRSVSENYYRYKKTLYQHWYNQDSDIWDGTGEPIQMYSNITGGYGIFAAYSEVRREVNN